MVLCAAFLLSAVFAADPQKTFEVASVKTAPERAGEDRFVKFDADGARIAYRNMNLKLMISIGWKMLDSRIVVPEEWMNSSPYDVAARLPAGASKDDIPAMLQTLVTERFQLTLHHESRTASAYDLVVSRKGSKLKAAAADGSGPNYMFRGRIDGQQYSMAALADFLTRQLGKPVVDATNLTGVYNVQLRWAPDEGKPQVASDAEGGSIFTALQEQLGLQLVPRKEAIDYLVIDHANRTPTEN